MKTYLSDVIPSLIRASKKLDDVTTIKNTHWKLIDEENNTRVVYIFRNSNELLISKNGQVEKGSWEYLGSNSLLIEVGDKSFLFKQGFYNEYILGLRKDGVDEYAILINEEKINAEVRNLKDLEKLVRIFKSEEASNHHNGMKTVKNVVDTPSDNGKSDVVFLLVSFIIIIAVSIGLIISD